MVRIIDHGFLSTEFGLRTSRGSLARFTRDLAAEAAAGRLEPVRCREAEVARIVDILLRHGKNNPMLVGEAGVGKTAIVEALAQHIAAGDVPHALRPMRVLALDHVALLAGTQFRGQYEERIQGIVEETTAAGNVILFVDEVHNLMGQGTALGAAMDAANMLKPALVRGDFRVIGATTDIEFERWIRADPALERRFQRVVVRELGSEETLEILQARTPILERHHDVVIHESALLAAVRLTDLFMKDRHRPDRALDVLDEACAHAQAVARLTPETEALARERRSLLRGGAARARAEGRSPGEAAAPELPHDARREDTIGLGPDVRLELPEFARDGFAALERFGAELGTLFEAQWTGTPTGKAEAAGNGAAGIEDEGQGTRMAEERKSEAAREASREPARASRSLADVEAELHARLVDEGVVVRGHDVARVISMITEKTISWVD